MTQDEYITKAPTLTIYDGLVKAQSVLEQYKNILVSVSGGADSDNMIDIVEHLTPNDSSHKVTYVWFDTGVEMNATKRHLTFLEDKYGIAIQRERGKMQVAGAVRTVGYPFYSKQFAEYIYIGFKNMGSNGKMNRLMSCAPNTRIVRLPFAGGVTLGKTNRTNHSRPKLHLQSF